MTVTWISPIGQVVSHTARTVQDMFETLLFLDRIGFQPDPGNEDHQVYETDKGDYIFSWSEGAGSPKMREDETPEDHLVRSIFEGGKWYD